MGCTPEQQPCGGAEYPAHQGQVGNFEISKYEVTWELWAAVIGEKHPNDNGSCTRWPVRGVSWDDTQAFLQKLNAGGGQYRLPSEAEWEYAARGGAQSQGYRYAGSNDPDAVAWHRGNSKGKLYAVGQKQANELGLYDMSGNVWEWVQDCYHENYAGAPTDGRARESGDCGRRILRGGSGNSARGLLRSAFRVRNPADKQYNGYGGFRIARSLF